MKLFTQNMTDLYIYLNIFLYYELIFQAVKSDANVDVIDIDSNVYPYSYGGSSICKLTTAIYQSE